MTRCIAPLEGDALCGAPAVTTRVVESLTCNLCAAHAAEMDDETMTTTTTTRIVYTDRMGATQMPGSERDCTFDGETQVRDAGDAIGALVESDPEAWADAGLRFETTTAATTWLITADCQEIGSFPGATREDAILAYCRDAGYASIEEAAAVQSKSVAAFIRELDVTEEG